MDRYSWIKTDQMRHAPAFFQHTMGVSIEVVDPTLNGKFAITDIELQTTGDMDRRIVVQVLNEDSLPLNNVTVGFHFSTYRKRKIFSGNWLWKPTHTNYFETKTRGGMAELILNKPTPDGGVGGVSVEILQPEYSSDFVSGLGMQADHSSPLLTFVLKNNLLDTRILPNPF